MKIQTIRCLLAASLAAIPGALQAQPDAHYVPGVEGIECATLPPPGWYFRDYNLFYMAQVVNNGAGHNIAPVGFQALTYATVPRLIYISDVKVLGGYLGGDVVLPIIYNSLKVPGFDKSTFGVGDFYGESTLSWHPKQFDIGSAVGFWAPSGDSSGSPTSTRAGLGFWTPELTLGVTWHPDEAKTWSVSALNRYEFNTKDRDTHETPGEAWTLEWGVSKKLIKKIDLGVVGYYQQRTTSSWGPDPGEFPQSRVAAVGPEINVFFPTLKLFTSLRYNYEFMAENRAQDHTVTLTLTKIF
jgi:hypothetical protein